MTLGCLANRKTVRVTKALWAWKMMMKAYGKCVGRVRSCRLLEFVLYPERSRKSWEDFKQRSERIRFTFSKKAPGFCGVNGLWVHRHLGKSFTGKDISITCDPAARAQLARWETWKLCHICLSAAANLDLTLSFSQEFLSWWAPGSHGP